MVNIKENSINYPILIGNNLITDINNLISRQYQGNKIFLVTDENVNKIYKDRVLSLLDKQYQLITMIVPPGEKAKSFKYLKKGYDKLIKNNFHRDDIVIGFGGGVVGDLAGFLAASYMRGISLIQIPTTLLAQVDSSVGGKTAINHKMGKNLIGAFYQPDQVIIDTEFLHTLPLRELKTGLAEVIKYSFIENQDNFYQFLYDKKNDVYNLKNEVLIDIINISCRIKSNIVKKDEKESGIRAVLNFGHTIAHALESYYNYEKYTHGEAVSIGMLGAGELSYKTGLLSKNDRDMVYSIISLYDLPQRIETDALDELYNKMKYDKKAKNNKLRWILLKEIGKPVIKSDIEKDLIFEAMEELQ
ncbi:MAG: 3-dehydroquinate synthase [Halanaerobiaceae bacterium]